MSHRPILQEIAGKKLSGEQIAYLDGLFAGLENRGLRFSDVEPDPVKARPSGAGSQEGITLPEDATQEERYKQESHPLDAYPLLLQHAAANQAPDRENTFRFKWHGLFYLSPAHEAFMARLRLPGGVLKSYQLRELAQLVDEKTTGYIQITTRANLQIRLIQPRDAPEFLRRLQSFGLLARGSGADNLRNLTCDPTSGLDPEERIETLPLTQQLADFILNHREFYNLPRKFNIALSGGGRISSLADTNDIGFEAVRVDSKGDVAVSSGSEETLRPGDIRSDAIPAGVYFRVALGGATGLKSFANDLGVLITPEDVIPVSAAVLRVYLRHGNRTDRKRARLKYLLEQWSLPRFLEETEALLGRRLTRIPEDAEVIRSEDESGPRNPTRHAHVGVFPQKQPGFNMIAVEVPVGHLTTRQLRRLADIADQFGNGEIRLTVWQSVLLPFVSDAHVESARKALEKAGFDCESSPIRSGFVACTGNRYCKYAAADTKGHALELRRWLEDRVPMDLPINIHVTGCPHSCAQHAIGDIGLLGAKVKVAGESVEGYHVFVGGGFGDNRALGRQIFQGVSYEELKPTLERMLRVYIQARSPGETFTAFTRRHDIGRLQELFSPQR